MSADLHRRLTATILARLETPVPAAWTPPWHSANPLPTNALTARRYRGFNVLALWCAAQAKVYPDGRWATCRQWAALGAQVRRGERGTKIVFYKDHEAGEGEPEPNAKRAFIARTLSVFDVAQVDGAYAVKAPAFGIEAPAPISTFMTFVATTEACIREGGQRACYVPATDTIHVPQRAAFRTAEGHAGTLAHELVHWSGAPYRLIRDLSGRFGARAYAAEEFVVEFGATFVLAEVGIARTPHPDHPACMASWLPLLRADPHTLSAAAQGLRATYHLMALPSPPPTIVPSDRPSVSAAADRTKADSRGRWTPFARRAA